MEEIEYDCYIWVDFKMPLDIWADLDGNWWFRNRGDTP